MVWAWSEVVGRVGSGVTLPTRISIFKMHFNVIYVVSMTCKISFCDCNHEASFLHIVLVNMFNPVGNKLFALILDRVDSLWH